LLTEPADGRGVGNYWAEELGLDGVRRFPSEPADILKNKQRCNNENDHNCDVLPHVYEIREILFIGFLKLTHGAKIRIICLIFGWVELHFKPKNK